MARPARPAVLLVVAAPVALLAAAASGEPPAATSPLAGIPNVEIQYYDVSGRNPREIREAMNRLRPADPNDGQRVDALTRWTMRFGWPRGGPAGCQLDRAQGMFTAVVQMPRLANIDAVPASVRARWQIYIAALETHEAGHVRHAFESVATVLAAIRASDCASAPQARQAAVHVAGAWDADYDRATRHGATQGATFP